MRAKSKNLLPTMDDNKAETMEQQWHDDENTSECGSTLVDDEKEQQELPRTQDETMQGRTLHTSPATSSGSPAGAPSNVASLPLLSCRQYNINQAPTLLSEERMMEAMAEFQMEHDQMQHKLVAVGGPPPASSAARPADGPGMTSSPGAYDVEGPSNSTNDTTITTTDNESMPGAYAVGPPDACAGSSHEDTACGDDDDLEQAVTPSAGGCSSVASNLLAVADPVDLPTLPEAVQVRAPPHSRQEQKGMCSTRILLGLLCIISIIIAAVLVIVLTGLARTSGKDSSSPESHKDGAAAPATPTNAGSNTPSTTTPKERIWGLLPQETRSQSQKEGTPQNKAVEWLLEDPAWKDAKALTWVGTEVPGPYNNQSETDDGPYPDWRILQRLALATLYYATEGDQWFDNTQWLDYSVHECHWVHTDPKGIEVVYPDTAYIMDILNGHGHPCAHPDDKANQGRYKHVWLALNNLRGEIPPEFFWLTSLKSFDFYSNWIQGSSLLSPDIQHLSSLTILSATRNQLRGNLPSELGLLTDLVGLFMNTNEVGESVPSELGLLTNLEQLTFGTNRLTGSLPTEIGMVRQLHYFLGYDNMFTGPLPSEIGRLSLLEVMGLTNNVFSGKLPTELGTLTRLQRAGVDVNQLNGAIPSELGLLDLDYLYLRQNRLSGSVPTEFFGGFDLFPEFVELSGHFSVMVDLTGNPLLMGTIPGNLCEDDDSLNDRFVQFNCSSFLCGCDCPC